MNLGSKSVYFCALFLASSLSAFAEDGGDLQTQKTATFTHQPKGEVNLFGGQTRTNTRVDGAEAETGRINSFGANTAVELGKANIGFEAQQLNRQSDDKRQQRELSKTTGAFTPAISYAFSPSWQGSLSYTMFRTEAENSQLGNKTYRLDRSRYTLGASKTSTVDSLNVSFASEAYGKEEYALGGYPMVDRDYVPAQVQVSYTRNVLSNLTVGGLLRYSDYNHDVYKDQYDSDVPKTPTFGQVFDYLLSFGINAAYKISEKLEVNASIERKAALDVNTLTGDEYVVAYKSEIGAHANLLRNMDLGASIFTSEGKKDHEVNKTSYNYASRNVGFETAVAVKF